MEPGGIECGVSKSFWSGNHRERRGLRCLARCFAANGNSSGGVVHRAFSPGLTGGAFSVASPCRRHSRNRLRRIGRSRREPSAGLSSHRFSLFCTFARAACAAVRRLARVGILRRRRCEMRREGGATAWFRASRCSQRCRKNDLRLSRVACRSNISLCKWMSDAATRRTRMLALCAFSRTAVHFEVLRCIRKTLLCILMIRIGGSERTYPDSASARGSIHSFD